MWEVHPGCCGKSLRLCDPEQLHLQAGGQGAFPVSLAGSFEDKKAKVGARQCTPTRSASRKKSKKKREKEKEKPNKIKDDSRCSGSSVLGSLERSPPDRGDMDCGMGQPSVGPTMTSKGFI
ncbi:hypothetical protein STEG23_034583 [Scotinomys teguina]